MNKPTVAVLVAVLGGALLASCASRADRTSTNVGGHAQASVVAQQTASLKEQITLPPGYGPIGQLVGDPQANGVWFWDATSTQDTVFDWNRQTLRSWPVLTGDSFSPARGEGGIAEDADADIWLGVNSTIVELDPTTGDTHTWRVTGLRANPVADSYLPPPLRAAGEAQAIDALAVSPSGLVAVAVKDTSSVAELNPTTGSVSAIPMPTSSDQPISVAFRADGTLAVGVSDLSNGGQANEVLLNAGGANPQLITMNTDGSAWDLTPTASSEIVVGNSAPQMLTSSGDAETIPVADLTGSPESRTQVVALSGEQFLGATDNGIEQFSAQGNITQVVQAPTVSCDADLGSSGGGLTPGGGQTVGNSECPLGHIDVFSVDGNGNVWLVEPNAPETVAEFVP